MNKIRYYSKSNGECIELYDETNGFDIFFSRCDLGKIVKIFKRLLNNEYIPPMQNITRESYNLNKFALLNIDATLKSDILGGNWVAKSRLKPIYDTLVKLYNKEQLCDLRKLKACYRKDKKALKEKLSVADIATLNNIADKLKRREKCVR